MRKNHFLRSKWERFCFEYMHRCVCMYVYSIYTVCMYVRHLYEKYAENSALLSFRWIENGWHTQNFPKPIMNDSDTYTYVEIHSRTPWQHDRYFHSWNCRDIMYSMHISEIVQAPCGIRIHLVADREKHILIIILHDMNVLDEGRKESGENTNHISTKCKRHFTPWFTHEKTLGLWLSLSPK